MGLADQLDDLGVVVAAGAVPAFESLIDELLRWNRRRNLTAITKRSEVLEKHLVDSLTLLDLVRSAERLLDIGSGPGFPALPLKIACPKLDIVTVEAVGKKVDFQRHIVRKLKLTGYEAVHDRIEHLVDDSSYCRAFDLVVARALCPLSDLVTMASPFLLPGGRIVAMKGPEGEAELAAMEGGWAETDWEKKLHRFVLPVSRAERCLIELTKSG